MGAAQLRGASLIIAIFFSLALSACEPSKGGQLGLEVASASAERNLITGGPIVVIRLTEQSGKQFGRFSLANLGKPVDIRIDGKSVTKPIIRDPITGGSFQIEVPRQEQAEELAARLTNRTATLEVEGTQN